MRKYNILVAPFGFTAGEQGSSLAPSYLPILFINVQGPRKQGEVDFGMQRK